MSRSLRSILDSGSRVRKRSRPSSAPQHTAAAPSSPRRPRARQRNRDNENEAQGELFPDLAPLPYQQDTSGGGGGGGGRLLLLAEELTLRDVVQAMRYVRSHIFAGVPETAARGLSSGRRAELLRYRASMPPLVTAGHVHAVLAASSPTRIEREVAELVAKGTVRKVRVERRRGGSGGGGRTASASAVAAGEALIETSLLMDMLRWSCDAGTICETTRAAYAAFLERYPTAQEVSGSGSGSGSMLSRVTTDELVRAGFLTSAATSARAMATTTLQARPEDRTTLTSIERVSQSASGTLWAVGGQNAIHMAGGSGGSAARSLSSSSPAELYCIAIPGHGRHLKLAEQCMDWLREALGRTKWGQGPEDWLRERFEARGLYGARWSEFHGVEWAWVLGEAVGLGIVEVFETGAVGRGVRALGG